MAACLQHFAYPVIDFYHDGYHANHFLESLVLVGLLLTDMVIMTNISVFIGSRKVDFYYA